MSFWPYPRVLQLCFSLIEEISKVVYSIYPLIGTPSNDLCILLSFPVGRSVNPLGRNSLFPFFFRAVALPWSRWSLPSFFSVRFGSWSWARCSWPQAWFLESLPFRHFRPLPLAWSRLPLAKYFQSSRLAVCAAPKSWTFGVGWSPFIQSKILCQPKLLTIFGKSPTPGKNHFFYCSFFGGVKKSIKENSTFS